MENNLELFSFLFFTSNRVIETYSVQPEILELYFLNMI